MLKILILYDPTTPLLVIYLLNRIASIVHQDTVYTHIHGNSVAAKMGTSHMSINSRIDRQIANQ